MSRAAIAWLACLACLALAAPSALAAPQRVVSMNLCTDQLAMLLAAPGQLVGITRLSRDSHVSPLSAQAQNLPVHGNHAEQVHLLDPDLVIAGDFTPLATLQALRHLGHDVRPRPPAESIDDIRREIAVMGEYLGRQRQAGEVLARFDRELQKLRDGRDRGRAVIYYANGLTAGSDTLAGDILTASGYRNIADELGIAGTAPLPVEQLLLAAPDLLVTGGTWPGHSRSEAILNHPALAGAAPRHVRIPDHDWVCGTPFVLSAIRSLQQAGP